MIFFSFVLLFFKIVLNSNLIQVYRISVVAGVVVMYLIVNCCSMNLILEIKGTSAMFVRAKVEIGTLDDKKLTTVQTFVLKINGFVRFCPNCLSSILGPTTNEVKIQ